MKTSSRRAEKETEGVVKFNFELKVGPEPEPKQIAELNVWRALLLTLGLTGRRSNRYGGLAYGNLSQRDGRDRFLITGSQTAHKKRLVAMDYCRIIAADLGTATIIAEGSIAPSSETLSHAAIYQANPSVNCVIHIHSPAIWRKHDALRIPSTPRNIPYGTPAMAEALRKAVSGNDDGLICMGGHTDGVISYGATAEISAMRILRKLGEALSLE